MGMTCYFVALSNDDLADIESNPALLLTLTLDDVGELSDEERELLGLSGEAQTWTPRVQPLTLYTDKAWDGMNFLLQKAGDQDGFPYTFITEGGVELPDNGEWGYGPPRVFSADEVKAIAGALKDLDVDALYQQTEPEELTEADVYCSSADEPKETSLGYFTHYLSELKGFIRNAASQNFALIVYLA